MRGRALYRAAASGRRFSSWDSKLLAGAAFVPAGFSSGTGVCARGGRSAGRCGSIAAVCRRFAHGIAVLLERLAFGSRLSFFLCQEKRDGLRCLAFLFRMVEIAIRAFSLCLYGYLPLAGSLRVCAFLYGDLDGLPGCGGRGYGVGGAAFVRFCAGALALESFRGEYAGAARPKPAPKSLRLSGLSSRCGGVGLVRTRGLTESASAPITAPTLAKLRYTERPDRL